MSLLVGSNQLRVNSHLSQASCFGGHPILLRSPFPGRAVAPKSSDHRCVDFELCSAKEREPVDDHFQSPGIFHVRFHQAQVPDHHVGGYSATCFSADSRCSVLNRPSSSSQDPRQCASCSMMATGVEWKDTLAVTHGQGKRKVQATEQNDTEQLGGKTRQSADRTCGQCQPCTSTTPCPDHPSW